MAHMMHRCSVPAFALLLPLGVMAQSGTVGSTDLGEGFTCLANHPVELQRHLEANPGALEAALQARDELEAWTTAFEAQRDSAGTPYVIPVVVHIIHNNGPENISDQQVYDAIRVLNEDFNRQNANWQNVRPEFLPIVADVGIAFRLARKDPQGNCTNGITRTVSPLTHVGDFEMTQLIQWPRQRYMNVWVCAYASGAAGYTYYPMWLNNWPEADGMVLRSDYMGSIGTSNPGRSHVLTHEVGHWINLKHVWGDSNEPGSESNCFMDDDVEDTPLTRGWTSCFLLGNSCGSPLDNVENFMEYAYCMRMFTHGQSARMLSSLTSPIAQRNQLWQPQNLAFTGVDEPPVLCQAAFSSDRREVCAGGTVRFFDNSYNGVVQRTWSFPGGTPSTSNDAEPVVTYTEPGSYPVSLTVSDGTTSLSTGQEAVISVLPNPGDPWPWSEGFEGITSVADNGWTTRDRDGNGTWAVTNTTGHSGTNSIRLLNGPGATGSLDDLISRTFDMSGAEQIRIGFRYAYAQRNPGNDDRLRLYVSNTCGESWSMRRQLRGPSDLNTGGTVGGDFVPTADQWGHTEVANISSNFHSSNFRIRFEFVSDGGNHVYIDDININGLPVGMDEFTAPAGAVLVVPNPAQGAAQLVWRGERSGRTRIDLLDALGRTLAVVYEGAAPAQQQRMDLPVSGLVPGLYLVRIADDHGARNLRFVLE